MLYGDTVENIRCGAFATQEQARDMASELIELRRKASGFAGHEATFIYKTEDLRAKVAALEAQLGDTLLAALAALAQAEGKEAGK